jgi:hypothetical protein
VDTIPESIQALSEKVEGLNRILGKVANAIQGGKGMGEGNGVKWWQ